MAEFKIRRAKEADFQRITELWIEMMSYHLSFDSRFELAVDHKESYLEYLRSIQENYDYAVFVAEEGDEIIGYTIGMILSNPTVFSLVRYGFIAEMMVSESKQRTGCGEKLWEHARRWFKRRGITVIQLNVSPHNKKGYNFWKKVGCNEFLHIMWHDIPKDA